MTSSKKVIDELITERRNAVMNDWQSFLRQPSPFVVEKVIERSKAGIPDRFVPWAPGVVVASTYLLEAANCRPGTRRPKGWRRRRSSSLDFFAKDIEGRGVAVAKCGNIWYIEGPSHQTLVYTFGSLPVGTRTLQEAMLLAEFCYPCPGGAAASLRWLTYDKDGILEC